jgi:hypothetical protein
MLRLRPLSLAAALTLGLAAAPLVNATPAWAELPCEWGDTSVSPWNYPIDGVACVVLDTSNGIRLVAVTNVQPGWTYQVKSVGGGTASDPGKVEVRFTNASTKSTLTFRFEPGKTKIG